MQQTSALRVPHDEECCAILDGAPRIQELRLAEDRATRSFGDTPQCQERRISNGAEYVIADAHVRYQGKIWSYSANSRGSLPRSTGSIPSMSSLGSIPRSAASSLT